MTSPTSKSRVLKQVYQRLFNGCESAASEWISWAESRAATATISPTAQPISLSSNFQPGNDQTALADICQQVKSSGYSLYTLLDVPPDVPAAVSKILYALGLRGSDSGVIRDVGELSLLQDATGTPKGRFPPYQPKAMNWHTDGYYNAPSQLVRCFTLHCIEPAADGGALVLMDDALLILALLQDDPELVNLLSHPEAMTLPNNKDTDGHDRPDRSVPVIQCNADGSLSMRFTTRSQHISWRCAATKAAALRATELISTHEHWQTRLTLQRGQGVVTRNVLHAREKFVDTPGAPKRQILRGRFTNLPTLANNAQNNHSTAENQ